MQPCTMHILILLSSSAVHRVRDRDRDTSRTRGTGTEFDFKMDRAKLALQDPTLKDGFAADDRCGLGPWTVGVVKDLGPTWGCALLGLAVPSTEFELVKLDMDNKVNSRLARSSCNPLRMRDCTYLVL